ncbi:mitochondrial 3' processome subunit 1 [Trypanosoma cruzi]|nr:mitochondrial 3' processome subunit 1 [Trypanosoma cruzi]
MQHEEPEEAETDAKLIPSLKDVACILYGSKEKQRAAYECLLVWLKQSDQFDLRLASPNGRYVGAIGIAIVDIDRFATERFGSEILKGEWVLLRVSGKNVPALKRVTQCTQTPYALTRLFSAATTIRSHTYGMVSMRLGGICCGVRGSAVLLDRWWRPSFLALLAGRTREERYVHPSL